MSESERDKKDQQERDRFGVEKWTDEMFESVVYITGESTPGEWFYDLDGRVLLPNQPDGDKHLGTMGSWRDAQFCAEAHTLLLAAIVEIERLQKAETERMQIAEAERDEAFRVMRELFEDDPFLTTDGGSQSLCMPGPAQALRYLASKGVFKITYESGRGVYGKFPDQTGEKP